MTEGHCFALHADLAASLSEPILAECNNILNELSVVAALTPVAAQAKQWHPPYRITIHVRDGRFELSFDAISQNFQQVAIVPLIPLKGLIRDYDIVCKSHDEAVHAGNPYRLEAVDMGPPFNSQ